MAELFFILQQMISKIEQSGVLLQVLQLAARLFFHYKISVQRKQKGYSEQSL